ncbi:MAG: nickel-dependent lactate racemase [Candidatus Coatesbacteria bacterium]|nr:nickel-dependent lactate racemase [Candidatus Coatesbacteria bacterium]
MAGSKQIKIDIPYGSSAIGLRIPRRNLARIVAPAPLTAADNLSSVKAAIDDPVDSESFSEFISHPGEEILLVVNDAARPTPTARVLPVLLDAARHSDFFYAVATGAHPVPSKEELNWIFGDMLRNASGRIFMHDSRRSTDMVELGTTSRGTRVAFNQIAIDADRIMILSSVEPHYFAGYTGGRKSLLPGLAAFKTIEQNHSLALLPGVMPLALKGNPVHEDMLEGVSFLKDKSIFSINLVQDGAGRIYTATAGALEASFLAATKKTDEIYVVPIEERADLVISVARPPLDRDLYQMQKALEHALLAVKEGGIIILVSKCSDGVGEDSYLSMLKRFDTPEQVLQCIKTEKTFGCHKAGRLARAALSVEIIAVTDIDPYVIRSAFMEPYSFLQQALDNSLDKAGPDASVVVLMDGSMTVPRVE